MLAFLGVLLIGLPSPQAQVRYNFQSPDQITISGAPVALPMDCLAANGYGQWTSSSTSLGESNLLTNMLASTGEDNAQDGVLSDNGFAFSIGDSYPTADAIKCAANLKGNVRYVWLNAARNAFYVEGFDPGAAGIDISFMGLPSVTSIVNAPALTATTFSLLSTHTVVNSIHESNPLDRFDVAIDASNLYIVWEEFSASKYSVWAMVIDLSTGLATMTPTQVTPSTGGGRRPTVAVDIRNSGSVAPFDVVCLSQTAADNSMDHYNSDVAFLGDGQFTLAGSGETMTSNGTSSGTYVSAISDPVKWTIHNTGLNLAPCNTTNAIGMTATDAIFDFMGNNIILDFQGSLVMFGNATFTKCQFKPDPTSTIFGYSVWDFGNGTWDPGTSTGTGDGNYNSLSYPSSDSHTITFNSCYATTGINAESNGAIAPASLVVSGGEYDDVGIAAGVDMGGTTPLWWPISITEAGFDHINGQGIITAVGFEPVTFNLPSQAYSILMDNNDFKTFAGFCRVFRI